MRKPLLAAPALGAAARDEVRAREVERRLVELDLTLGTGPANRTATVYLGERHSWQHPPREGVGSKPGFRVLPGKDRLRVRILRREAEQAKSWERAMRDFVFAEAAVQAEPGTAIHLDQTGDEVEIRVAR